MRLRVDVTPRRSPTRRSPSSTPRWATGHWGPEDGIPKLARTFRFGNFGEALAFTAAVGELAEQEGHHPRIVTEWGRVAVTWWTHKIRGLHRNDFIMAAKTDQLFAATQT